MYPDLTTLVDSIQQSNIAEENKGIVCKAVQDHYKELARSSAITTQASVLDEKPVVEKSLSKMNKTELGVVCDGKGITLTGEETKNEILELLK